MKLSTAVDLIPNPAPALSRRMEKKQKRRASELRGKRAAAGTPHLIKFSGPAMVFLALVLNTLQCQGSVHQLRPICEALATRNTCNTIKADPGNVVYNLLHSSERSPALKVKSISHSISACAGVARKSGASGSGAAAASGATAAGEAVAAAAVSPALASMPEGIQGFMGQQGFEQPTEIQRRSVDHKTHWWNVTQGGGLYPSLFLCLLSQSGCSLDKVGGICQGCYHNVWINPMICDLVSE